MNHLYKDRRLHALLAANMLSSIGSGITMIAIPWLLVNREGGEQILGYVALGVTLILFIVSPYVGVLVDRMSRKKMMLLSEVLGFTLVSVLSFWGLVSGEFATWNLIALYFSGSLYYTLHYPTKMALNQELFDRSQFKSINSIIEVQGQAASMIAGGIASLLIERIDLFLLLCINISTYIIGFFLILTIPYSTVIEHTKKKVSILSNMIEGFRYFKSKPLLILFFTCSFLPFIAVMVGNYLFPVYIAKTLQANASVMGLSDMIYAIGAVLAGLTIPLIIKKFGNYVTILITMLLFTISLLITAWIPLVPLFLAMKIALGWGNAGTRVARNTIMMEIVPNELIGRVNSFFQAVGMGMRVSLIGFFTQTIVHTGVSISLSILGMILCLAFVGVWYSKKLFTSPAQATEPSVSS
ncbi:MFS transporter [Bacillus horti]|uniref:MFS family permease n=1 Tax=Caldalkalibacillus horti TaxID=77523 RepID=A0ABT9W1Y8_9BACI|nr:MFS transporter [Bacillus horti]MDQ0167262.1 MFS family permease [Bacillus horti]